MICFESSAKRTASSKTSSRRLGNLDSEVETNVLFFVVGGSICTVSVCRKYSVSRNGVKVPVCACVSDD